MIMLECRWRHQTSSTGRSNTNSWNQSKRRREDWNWWRNRDKVTMAPEKSLTPEADSPLIAEKEKNGNNIIIMLSSLAATPLGGDTIPSCVASVIPSLP